MIHSTHIVTSRGRLSPGLSVVPAIRALVRFNKGGSDSQLFQPLGHLENPANTQLRKNLGSIFLPGSEGKEGLANILGITDGASIQEQHEMQKQDALQGINFARDNTLDRTQQMLTQRGLTGGVAAQGLISAEQPFVQQTGKTIREFDANKSKAVQDRFAKGVDIMAGLTRNIGATQSSSSFGIK